MIDDDKLKCYMDCLLQEMGMYMPNGKIDIVNLHESFNEDKEIHFDFLHMIRKCLYPKGSNACEVAYDLQRCWKVADPKVIINYFIFNCFESNVFSFNHFQHYFLA